MPKQTMRQLLRQHAADHAVNIERICDNFAKDDPRRARQIEQECERRAGYMLEALASRYEQFAADVRRETQAALPGVE